VYTQLAEKMRRGKVTGDYSPVTLPRDCRVRCNDDDDALGDFSPCHLTRSAAAMGHLPPSATRDTCCVGRNFRSSESLPSVNRTA